MLIENLSAAMATIAPLHFAEAWDNVGLLVGSSRRELTGPVVLTIDLTERVIEEARAMRASAVVAYHPPIFHPLKRLTLEGSGRERAIYLAVEAGLAVYSPHTALDAAPGGTTDWLADGLLDRQGIVKADRRALRPQPVRAPKAEIKIVTFVPAASLDLVRQALATAGAGMIGRYEVCSFATPGTGTFFGGPGAKPASGEAGRLERVDEVRLEMVCPERALALALETLRQFHPYEEPAVDVYTLHPGAERAAGAGRRLVLDQPATLERLADRVKTYLNIPAVQVAAARWHGPGTRIECVGVCPGSGAELAALAVAQGCEVFLTGEMKHHETLAALDAGMSVICAGHTQTERGYLPRLAERLTELLPGVRVVAALEDASPYALR